MQEKVTPASIVHTDMFRSYHARDGSAFHHLRINRSKLFADKKNHIHGTENFWNQAKRPLRKFNGIKQDNFYRLPKEEFPWRFKGGHHKALLKQLQYWYQCTKH